jgi:tetratricopeptide (TPR) repeat protein
MFQAQGNAWWACRTLWGLSLVAIPLGQWARSLEYCRRALDYGQRTGDRRLTIVGWWRTGWTHIQRGDPAQGLACCDQALALEPGPFDAAMARAARGYGLIKAGRAAEGLAELTGAVAWLERAQLRFTRAWYAIWLADGHLRLADPHAARRLAEDVLALSREVGYRYFEGLAERLLGTSLVADDPPAAARHLDTAMAILDEVGARNEVARVLMAQAELCSLAGDARGARARQERALAIFEALDTIDEIPRLRAALQPGAAPA